MRASSRLVSPAGFALVLLLFLFLPFLSVSCEVPGMGTIGADYTGAQLAVGDEPEVRVPPDLRDMAEELPGGGGENSEPPPDPGVRVLATVAAVLMAAGVATAVLPRVRPRLLAAAGVAVLAGVLVVVTQFVARANLTDQLRSDAQDLSDDEIGTPDVDQIAEEMIHTEIGFWLTVVGLALIALFGVAVAYRDRLLPRPAPPPAGAA